jgi:hypothetical protein
MITEPVPKAGNIAEHGIANSKLGPAFTSTVTSTLVDTVEAAISGSNA